MIIESLSSLGSTVKSSTMPFAPSTIMASCTEAVRVEADLYFARLIRNRCHID